jgi:glycosyltransferase involved in cell wall biosynthesis
MTVISFVIPVKDESENIKELASRIFSIFLENHAGQDVEIIIIDDGSRDNSWALITQLAEGNSKVKGIRLRRNFGKAIALDAGFRAATGDIVFTMDGDLQDDPKEIPRFLEKLNEGYDLVSGWKFKRYDPLSKTLPSRLFNKVTSWATGVNLHDFNCGFKCYKKEVIDRLNIYGELHRYVPVLAADLGFKVGEIKVEHHPRQHGVSKYGWERYLRGLVDLITVLATTRWLNKPGHLFGGIGVLFGVVGGSMLLYLSALWLMGMGPIGNRPLLLFGVLFSISSLQMISLGVIAEFFIKARNSNNVDALISERLGS